MLAQIRAPGVAFRAQRPQGAARAVRAPQPVVLTSSNVLSGSVVGSSSSSEVAGVSVGAPASNFEGCFTMMRHGNRVKHLGRPQDQRKALIRSLVTEVIRHGQIRTTKVKAKVIRSYVDKMITLAKDGSLHARRQALAFVYDKELVQNLFNAAPERYAERQGGYTRIKTEPFLRRGDAAEMAIIELV